jgi:hypothetical protein
MRLGLQGKRRGGKPALAAAGQSRPATDLDREVGWKLTRATFYPRSMRLPCFAVLLATAALGCQAEDPLPPYAPTSLDEPDSGRNNGDRDGGGDGDGDEELPLEASMFNPDRVYLVAAIRDFEHPCEPKGVVSIDDPEIIRVGFTCDYWPASAVISDEGHLQYREKRGENDRPMFEWRCDGRCEWQENDDEADYPEDPLGNDIAFDEDEEPRYPGRYLLSGMSIIDQETSEQRPITGLPPAPIIRTSRASENGLHLVLSGGGVAGSPSLWKVSPDGTAMMIGSYADGAPVPLTEMGADRLDANLELYTLVDVGGITSVFIRSMGGSMSLRDVPLLADHSEIDGWADGLVTGN